MSRVRRILGPGGKRDATFTIDPDPRINRIPGIRPAVRPTRIPPNILQGIGQIPRFNLDFAKLPKAPIMPTAPVQTKLPVQPMPVTRGVSEVISRPSIERTAEVMPVTAPPVTPQPAQPTRQVANDAPFAAGIRRIETGLDPLTKQLLFGLDGRGGFIRRYGLQDPSPKFLTN